MKIFDPHSVPLKTDKGAAIGHSTRPMTAISTTKNEVIRVPQEHSVTTSKNLPGGSGQ